MILSFKTEINGKPTYFVEKIHKGLRDYKHNFYGLDPSIHYPPNYSFFAKDRCLPKIHTIRKDENDRWKRGVMIDFFINARQKNMFRFAPIIPVMSTQEIEINWYCELRDLTPSKIAPYRFDFLEVLVDGELLSIKEVENLAFNDGFESITEFFNFFNEDFTGKIIHWTDYQY